MADPLRLQIMKALTTKLETVTHDRFGDETETYPMTGKVFRGRSLYGDDDLLPMLSILEAPLPQETRIEQDDATGRAGDWELVIQGFCLDDKDNPTDPALRFAAEVEQVLALEKKKLRGSDPTDRYILGFKRIKTWTVGRAVCRPPDEFISGQAYFAINLSIDVAEDLDDPYAT